MKEGSDSGVHCPGCHGHLYDEYPEAECPGLTDELELPHVLPPLSEQTVVLVEPGTVEALREEITQYKTECEHLHGEINKLYRSLNQILEEVRSRRWICDGRGPYAYDDDDYRRETGWAFDAIEKIALEARALLADLEVKE